MQHINLDLVKPSPNPIRKTWDEQKMQELAQSIKEQGVIVPIKVRPNGAMTNFIAEIPGWYELYGEKSGLSFEEFKREKMNSPHPETWKYAAYEIVYGHRRVEAAKRAGLEEVPAIVETPDDKTVVWEALIENLSREDMSAYEKGREIDKLKNMGFSVVEQSRRIGVGNTLMHNWHTYYRERSSGIEIHDHERGELIEQVSQVKAALKDDLKAKQDVINKASSERLDRFETRAVADAYVKADTPELKQSVLETSGKLGDADRILQVAEMKVTGRKMADHRERQKERVFEGFDSTVKDFLDAIKLFDRMVKMATQAAKYGKFSPEARNFTVRRIDSAIEKLEILREELRNE